MPDEKGAQMSIDEASAKQADALIEKGDGDKGAIALSTGVKLRAKPVPPMVLIESLTQVDRPKVPVFFDERMEREIENPDDPDYKDRVARYNMDFAMGVLNTMILFGVEIESIPKELAGPDSDEWIENRKLAGMSVMPESKSWRKLAWIKSVAVATPEDNNLITEVVGGLSGVREDDVARAAEAFRGEEKPN